MTDNIANDIQKAHDAVVDAKEAAVSAKEKVLGHMAKETVVVKEDLKKEIRGVEVEKDK